MIGIIRTRHSPFFARYWPRAATVRRTGPGRIHTGTIAGADAGVVQADGAGAGGKAWPSRVDVPSCGEARIACRTAGTARVLAKARFTACSIASADGSEVADDEGV